MIYLIARVISLFALVVQKALLLASVIGELIVTCAKGLTNVVYKAFENITLFLQVVYEDNFGIFAEDIPNFVNDVMMITITQIKEVLDNAISFYSEIIYQFHTTFRSLINFVSAAFIALSDILILLKDTTVLIGNTVWFILTFLPLQLPQIARECFIYVKDSIVIVLVDAYMALLKFTNYMTDVPLESFIGIASAILIVRSFVYFRLVIQTVLIELYWLTVRKALYLYYTFINYIMDSEVRVITHMASGQNMLAREVAFSADENDEGSNSDALCVICQERQKCVLTLPCRHVCLCTECCRQLYSYQRTCPVCRTFIYHSVTVYL